MITTVDGVIKKRGDDVYIIYLGLMPPKFFPLSTQVLSTDYAAIGVKFYESFELCQEQCNKMNQSDKNI